MKKVLLPGILGGLVVFIWSAISHTVLPIGVMGLKTIPNTEDGVLHTMKSYIQEPGIYIMPGYDMSRAPTDAEWKALEAKALAGPTAFLVYHPTGVGLMTPGQLTREAYSIFWPWIDRGIHHLSDSRFTDYSRRDGDADGVVRMAVDQRVVLELVPISRGIYHR